MKMIYEENPHPTLLLVDEEMGITLKQLGVSGIDAANKITDAVCVGTIASADLMEARIATGSDAIRQIEYIRNTTAGTRTS